MQRHSLWRRLRRAAGISAGVVALGLLTPLAAPTASAAACTSPIRYASSTNTIYLEAGEATLPDIHLACPAAPLTQTAPGEWLLGANLVVTNGAALRIRGTDATPAGTVDTLRLRSDADNSPLRVVTITAMAGTITIDSTTITSWDTAANAPDTNTSLPVGAPAGSRARAFIRALSYLDASGTPRTSRMDINASDIGYLGYYAAESYGVAYKARGCDITHPDVCAKLDVFGSQRGSRFHHNFMGTYTWGALNMVFDGNEYDNNVMYGLDPHDDSDYLTITRNHFHHNGDHGVICSQRCNNLLIANNESDHNGIPPYLPPNDPDITDNQVHGIMIHRGVTDTVIENNYVHDQPNGAGIAVFDSVGNTIRNNRIVGAKFGLRMSVGTKDAVFQNNTVTGSTAYAVYSYQGTDTATYSTLSGRPTNNTFIGNTFSGSGSYLARLTSTDGTKFLDNKVTGTVGTVRLEGSTGTVWQGSALPGTGLEHITTTRASAAVLRNPTQQVRVGWFGTGSVLDVVGTTGRVMQRVGSSYWNVANSTSTTLRLSNGVLGAGVTSFDVSPTNVRVVPAAGTLLIRLGTWAGTTRQILVDKGKVSTQQVYEVGGLVSGRTYTVRRDGTLIGTRVANTSGLIGFTLTETATGGAHTITVTG